LRLSDRQSRGSEAADRVADERGGRQIECGNDVGKSIGERGRGRPIVRRRRRRVAMTRPVHCDDAVVATKARRDRVEIVAVVQCRVQQHHHGPVPDVAVGNLSRPRLHRVDHRSSFH
jgi:hypothetical protein